MMWIAEKLPCIFCPANIPLVYYSALADPWRIHTEATVHPSSRPTGGCILPLLPTEGSVPDGPLGLLIADANEAGAPLVSVPKCQHTHVSF